MWSQKDFNKQCCVFYELMHMSVLIPFSIQEFATCLRMLVLMLFLDWPLFGNCCKLIVHFFKILYSVRKLLYSLKIIWFLKIVCCLCCLHFAFFSFCGVFCFALFSILYCFPFCIACCFVLFCRFVNYYIVFCFPLLSILKCPRFYYRPSAC